MKKKTKKLVLNRETLRQLEQKDLLHAEVNGASGRPICCTITASCPPPSADPC